MSSPEASDRSGEVDAPAPAPPPIGGAIGMTSFGVPVLPGSVTAQAAGSSLVAEPVGSVAGAADSAGVDGWRVDGYAAADVGAKPGMTSGPPAAEGALVRVDQGAGVAGAVGC